jgi:hypothetical protein
MMRQLESLAEHALMVAASALVIHNHKLQNSTVDPAVCLPILVIFSLYFIIHMMRRPSFLSLARRIGAWIFWLGILTLAMITPLFWHSLHSEEFIFFALTCMAIAMFGLYLRNSVDVMMRLMKAGQSGAAALPQPDPKPGPTS